YAGAGPPLVNPHGPASPRRSFCAPGMITGIAGQHHKEIPMLTRIMLGPLKRSGRRADVQRKTSVRLQVEPLEDRQCPSGGYLLVGDYDGNSVLRYDQTTGAFVDEFVPHNTGGLNQPQGLVFSPKDHNLYVTSGELYGKGNDKAVMRF